MNTPHTDRQGKCWNIQGLAKSPCVLRFLWTQRSKAGSVTTWTCHLVLISSSLLTYIDSPMIISQTCTICLTNIHTWITHHQAKPPPPAGRRCGASTWRTHTWKKPIPLTTSTRSPASKAAPKRRQCLRRKGVFVTSGWSTCVRTALLCVTSW